MKAARPREQPRIGIRRPEQYTTDIGLTLVEQLTEGLLLVFLLLLLQMVAGPGGCAGAETGRPGYNNIESRRRRRRRMRRGQRQRIRSRSGRGRTLGRSSLSLYDKNIY